jgi:hypothetical protein
MQEVIPFVERDFASGYVTKCTKFVRIHDYHLVVARATEMVREVGFLPSLRLDSKIGMRLRRLYGSVSVMSPRPPQLWHKTILHAALGLPQVSLCRTLVMMQHSPAVVPMQPNSRYCDMILVAAMVSNNWNTIRAYRCC